MTPVNRASRWRYNSSALRNYDDNGGILNFSKNLTVFPNSNLNILSGLFCGGYDVQHNKNGGKNLVSKIEQNLKLLKF